MKRYKITNISGGPARLPGPVEIIVPSKECYILGAGDFCLESLSRNRLFTIEEIIVASTPEVDIKSKQSKPLRKERSRGKASKTPATPDVSKEEEVSDNG